LTLDVREFFYLQGKTDAEFFALCKIIFALLKHDLTMQ